VYLLPDGSGKLAHPQPRMMLGSVRGGAVRLAPLAEVMGVAEGLETALSVQAATGLPMWAGLSTGGMQAVIWSESVRHVIICADHDKPGLAAAYATAEALIRQGKKASICKPDKAGADFNDLLREAGHD
jgi:putative DNA primase/helicase